jgi:hypothetical protein
VKKTPCFKIVVNNSKLVILTMTYTLYSVKILEYFLCKYAILPVIDDESFNQVASIPNTYWKYQLLFKEDTAQNPMPPFCTFQNDSSKGKVVGRYDNTETYGSGEKLPWSIKCSITFK